MVVTKVQLLESLSKITVAGTNTSPEITKRIENFKADGNKINFDFIVFDDEKIDDDLVKAHLTETIKQKISVSLEISISIKIKEKTSLTSHVERRAKNIIAIASGKGGVGKSTMASNLAIALSGCGYSVGLLDADIYGPSLPKMFDAEETNIESHRIDGRDLLIPIVKYGIRLMSVGFFIKPENATVWRGPMASNVFKQLLNDTDWGDLDFLLIDLPPGTSDIHLTLVQSVAVSGAVIITTPQDVALIDVVKGINMFKTESIDVPILGIIENMAWFTPAELPNNKYYIFGKDGGKNLAEKMGIPLLGQIPLVQSISESGDNGKPMVLNDNLASSEIFVNLAKNLITQTKLRNLKKPPTKKTNIKK